jgi:NAD(P)-dependent dehydrogenase (short-subunit alcohol dehydrogenase family)
MEGRVSKVGVDLRGKVTFVTGGGSGIGRGLALQFARDGAAVAVTDLDRDSAAAVCAEIRTEGGHSLHFAVDVANARAIEAALAETMLSFGQIDILFANAGMLGPVNFLETDASDWDRVLDVNLKGAIHACQAAAPPMMARRHGRILITSSVNGVRASAHVIPYRVSKSALLMYTRCLALALAPYGITVNALCPNVTPTPIQLDYAAQKAAERGMTADGYLAERASRIPMQQLTQVDDVVALAQFLVSDGGRLISGQAIGPDGASMAL